MSPALVMAMGAAASVSQFECDVMSYGVLEPAKVSRAILRLDDRGNATNVTFTAPGVRSLSGTRSGVKHWKDSDGLTRFWPVSIRTEAGNMIKLDLVQTQSTHANSGAALLISEGGDFAIGSLAENDESYIAVGICSEKQDVVK